MPDDYIIAKLDFSNAFNCLHMDAMLERVNEIIPELYKFCHLAYSQHSTLQLREFSLSPQQVPQQGEPLALLGGLLFCLAIQPIWRSLSSPLTIGFMDDVTIGDFKSTVNTDVGLFRIQGSKLGLNLDVSKCVVISPDQQPSEGPVEGFTRINPSDAVHMDTPLARAPPSNPR